MKMTKKAILWRGIGIPVLAWFAYLMICVGAYLFSSSVQPLPEFFVEIFIKIFLAFLVLKLIQRGRPVERRKMPGRSVAAMAAVFAIAVCVPAQLLAQAPAAERSGMTLLAYSLLVAPIGEEIRFRGILFGLSRRGFGFWPATAVSAILFQLDHEDMRQAIVTIPLAIAAAGIYEMTGNLKYCTLLHFVMNLLSIFFTFIHVPLIIALPLYAVSFALLIFTFSKREALSRLLRIPAGGGY